MNAQAPVLKAATLHIEDRGNGQVEARITYHGGVDPKSTAHRLAHHLTTVVDNICSAREQLPDEVAPAKPAPSAILLPG